MLYYILVVIAAIALVSFIALLFTLDLRWGIISMIMSAIAMVGAFAVQTPGGSVMADKTTGWLFMGIALISFSLVVFGVFRIFWDRDF